MWKCPWLQGSQIGATGAGDPAAPINSFPDCPSCLHLAQLESLHLGSYPSLSFFKSAHHHSSGNCWESTAFSILSHRVSLQRLDAFVIRLSIYLSISRFQHDLVLPPLHQSFLTSFQSRAVVLCFRNFEVNYSCF